MVQAQRSFVRLRARQKPGFRAGYVGELEAKINVFILDHGPVLALGTTVSTSA